MHDLTFCMAISYLAITSGLIWTCSRCCKTWSKPIKTILLFTLVLLLAYFPTIKLSITTIHTYVYVYSLEATISIIQSISNKRNINTRNEIGELFCNNFKLFHTHFVCFLQKILHVVDKCMFIGPFYLDLCTRSPITH